MYILIYILFFKYITKLIPTASIPVSVEMYFPASTVERRCPAKKFCAIFTVFGSFRQSEDNIDCNRHHHEIIVASISALKGKSSHVPKQINFWNFPNFLIFNPKIMLQTFFWIPLKSETFRYDPWVVEQICSSLRGREEERREAQKGTESRNSTINKVRQGQDDFLF